LRLRLAALEVLPQRCAQAPLLPDLRCALGIIAHWLKTMYRGGLAKGLGAMTDRRSAHACASSDPVAMGRRTQGRFPFPRFSPAAGRCRSSVVEHPLGKGEVVSSILTGSTIKPGFYRITVVQNRAEHNAKQRIKTHQIRTKRSGDVRYQSESAP